MFTQRDGIVELFAGLGCVARGFADTELFEVRGLTDINGAARDNTRASLPHVPYLCADVQDLDAAALHELATGGSIAGLLGCPPCQGFSAAGKRCDSDNRNALLYDYFRLVAAVEPRFFVMENVPAVLWRPELESALARLDGQYELWAGVLNAALYGLPQTRQRAIMIGYHRDLRVVPTMPPPTHAGRRQVFDYAAGALVTPTARTLPALLGPCPLVGVPQRERGPAELRLPADPHALPDLVTVGDALADLPPDSSAGYAAAPASAYAAALRGDETVLANHEAWEHRGETVERLAAVAEGGVPGAAAGRNSRYYSQAYARLHRRGLSRTVTTNFHNPGSGRFTHYSADRSITVREAARLQGISDQVRLTGSRETQERLVGNAFPPPWARVIGAHIASEIGARLRD